MNVFSTLWDIAKAKRGERVAGSKYIMRIPVGVDPRTGAPKYRYIYDVAHGGKHIHHEDFHQKGALIAGTHDGQEGHFHVKHSDDTHHTVKHSGSDKEFKISKEEFSKRLEAEHKPAIDRHKAHVIKTLKRLSEHYMPVVRVRYAQYAHQFGVTMASINSNKESAIDIAKDRLQDNIAHTLHDEVLPTPTRRLDEGVGKFKNPDPTKGMTEALPHQIEGAERILHAFDNVADGFLLQDEAGLGKTVTALLTAQESGAKKVLIVTPSSGKDNHIANWKHAGGLFGQDVNHYKDADLSANGTNVATYLDLFTTEKTIDPYTGKETKSVKLRPEFDANKFDLVIFDESHNMQNPESAFAQAGCMLQERCDKALYMSATPFTQLTNAHYLRKLGWFKNGDEFTEWAQNAGAKTVRSNETNGALPYKMTNPNSAVPLVMVSALMHTQGVGCRRQPILENSNHEFNNIPLADVSPAHLHAFDQAEKIGQIARDAGLSAYEIAGQMTLWRKQMWEAAKLPMALEAAKAHLSDGMGQVALFTESLQHGHSHLESLAKRLESGKGHGVDPAVGKAGGAKIRELLNSMPHPITDAAGNKEPIADHVQRVLGEHGISHIHGAGNSEEAQNQFQSGENRVMFGSQAKAGTGLSFHDVQGGRQRLQINMSLPWSAASHRQLSGRTDRLGQKSEPKQMWMVGDSDSERHVQNIVGSKLKSMGALVAGDPGQFVNAGALQAWENSTGTHDPHLMSRVQSAEFDDAPKSDDAEFEAARDHFRTSVDAYSQGHDPLTDYGDNLRTKRDLESYRQRRIAVAKLSNAGLKIHSHPGLRYRVSGFEPGSQAHEQLKNIQRGASIDNETGHAVIHNPKVFSRLVKELGLGKMSVDTPKDLSDTTLSELRQSASESASHAHLLVGHGPVGKSLRFCDLIAKAPKPKKQLRTFSELAALYKGEAPIGTVHTWANGKRMKKIAPHEWKEVLEGKQHPGQYEGPKAHNKRVTTNPRAQPVGDVRNMAFWAKQAEERGIDIPDSWSDIEIDRSPDLDKVDPASIRYYPKNDPSSKYLMQWTDPKSGKSMGAYSFEFHRKNAAAKWAKVVSLFEPVTDGKALKHFEKGYSDKKSSTRMQDAHACMAVITHTGFRAGAEEHLEKSGTRGANTLAIENVKVNGSRVEFSFIGKKGKENTGFVEDAKLASFIKGRMKGKKEGDQLFSCTYQDLNNLCKAAPFGSDVTPHNFRTVAATVKAAEELANRPVKLTGDSTHDLPMIEKAINDASKAVAEHLNNTPAMAKKSYIHPALVQSYLNQIGGSEYEGQFFNINKAGLTDLCVARIKDNKPAHDLLKYAMNNWEPHFPRSTFVSPPPENSPDDLVDGYLKVDVFH